MLRTISTVLANSRNKQKNVFLNGNQRLLPERLCFIAQSIRVEFVWQIFLRFRMNYLNMIMRFIPTVLNIIMLLQICLQKAHWLKVQNVVYQRNLKVHSKHLMKRQVLQRLCPERGKSKDTGKILLRNLLLL